MLFDNRLHSKTRRCFSQHYSTTLRESEKETVHHQPRVQVYVTLEQVLDASSCDLNDVLYPLVSREHRPQRQQQRRAAVPSAVPRYPRSDPTSAMKLSRRSERFPYAASLAAAPVLILTLLVVQSAWAATPLDLSGTMPTCAPPQPLGAQCKNAYSKGPVLINGQCRIAQQCCRLAKDKCPTGTQLYYLGEIGTANSPCYECL